MAENKELDENDKGCEHFAYCNYATGGDAMCYCDFLDITPHDKNITY